MTNVSGVAPAPCSQALQALVKLLGLRDVQLSSTSTDSSEVSIKCTIENVLTKTSSMSTSLGWTASARTLCGLVGASGLWGDSADNASLIEGWIDKATEVLVPVILKQSTVVTEDSSPSPQEQVGQFASSIESHLSQNNLSCLVGDAPTAADVVVSIWLAQACAEVSITKLPQKTYRLLLSITSHKIVQQVVGSVAAGLQEGDAAPIEQQQPASDDALAGNPIVAKLVEWNIPHSVYSHVLCNTADELVANVPVPGGDSHTKNLFFKDKKHGLFLVTLKTSTDLNTKALGSLLNLEGKVNLRLATSELLMEYLGCKPGCVGPLSIVNDLQKQVTLVLDEALLNVEHIHSHPLRNDASVVLTPAALQDYLQNAAREPVVLDFSNQEPAPAAGKPPASRPPSAKTPKSAPDGKKPAPAQKSKDKKTSKKGETLLALQWKKEENFAMWYSDVIVLSEMISYYDISGCYILRPWSYKMWELIQDWFNVEIRNLDVENSYFPLFVSQDRLEKEKDHVEGFAPEVAWVTKSGDGVLAKPIAVRPTSETIMYPAFSDWIKSHRDLPLKLNQWSNVVRWEFKDPTPFLRSREFLWQEGHTAHATLEDADVMVQQALELYRRVYEELLAVPVIPGYKTEKEKFAGGYQTTTVEAYIPMSGRAIQGATSHNLGQNFGKMFDITYQDEKGGSQVVWQTSWGLTTRSLGVMIMVHGDDTGLVIPPRIAPLQVIIVPIVSKKLSMEEASPYCESILKELKAEGIRAKFDDRDMYNPGWKYNHWEQKGVPIRIEVGPRDVEQNSARIVIRHSGEKFDMQVDGLAASVKEKLEAIQKDMFKVAEDIRDSHVVKVTEWKDFVPNLELNNLVMTPWCGGEHQDWEEWVKEKSREESLQNRGEQGEDARTATSVAAKTLCIPFDQPQLPEGTKCIASGMPATCWVLWGRSY